MKLIYKLANSFDERFCCNFDLVMTDIPYNISRTNNIKTMTDRNGRTGIDFGEWDNEPFDVNKINVNCLKHGGSLFTFHSFEQFSSLKDTLESKGMIFKDKIILQSSNPMPRNTTRRFVQDIQMGSWYVKKGDNWIFNKHNHNVSNKPISYERCVITTPAESGAGHKRYHATQKPIKAVKYLIEIFSNEGDYVLDPFAGGATTLIACTQCNRNCLAIEKDKNIFNQGVKRIYEYFNEQFAHRNFNSITNNQIEINI